MIILKARNNFISIFGVKLIYLENNILCSLIFSLFSGIVSLGYPFRYAVDWIMVTSQRHFDSQQEVMQIVYIDDASSLGPCPLVSILKWSFILWPLNCLIQGRQAQYYYIFTSTCNWISYLCPSQKSRSLCYYYINTVLRAWFFIRKRWVTAPRDLML